MARIILALSVLVAVAVSINAAPSKTVPRERPGFIFLGSTKKEVKVTIDGITSVTYEDWNYWMSVNAAGYAEALRDCKANGDSLLEIDDIDERDMVEAWLQDTDQSMSLAWVGGKYNSGSQSFRWESGSEVVDDLWAAGQPSQKKPNSRVVADTTGQIIQLKAQANTQTTRYICEGQ